MLTRSQGALDLREGRAVPAVDLLGGRVVRLEQGRYDRVTAYPVEPVALARAYAEAGAPWLHVVDLDAARTGVRSPEHAVLLRELRAVPGLRIQLGGGLRGEAEIRAALADVADRVIVGTLAAAEPELVGRLAAETGRVVAGLDCRDGRVRTHGWLEDAGLGPADLVARLARAGASDFLVTGIERDGTGRGPDVDLVASVRAEVPGLLLAAGGVGSAADVGAAVAAGADAVIVGKAMLDARITFA
ncbi:MAG TPA: 1-(5-phosphoribosyl)-5-[(5-phosphoribosylamino)methylideneamino] imidazole-4-carboxamide isomerase [Gaiellales bacterium]|nr:1-(5-phosphoribosyl)-5-[(5-phosphoribosylamino)methylideneamino] imidazole-4-carboxamide isomerase [Gaiellales bacterium]